MPDSERRPERGLERDLRDLGSRIEYPPTPDLARAVRHRLDAEGGRTPRRGFRHTLLSPRWAVPGAALVLVLFVAISPAVRGSLSDLFVSGQAASSGAGGGAEGIRTGAGETEARPESGGSDARSRQEPDVVPQAAAGSATQTPSAEGLSESAAAGSASPAAGAAGGYPSSSLRIEPARAAPGATFRLRGEGFPSGCDTVRPARDIRIDFRQGERTWKLTTVDADRRHTFDARLRVPAGARPGRATVRAATRCGEPAEEKLLVLR